MLKLSNVTRKAAFAAVLGTGLAGSAALVLAPPVAQAQQWRGDDRGFRGDTDDRSYRGDWDDRYRGGRDWDDRFHVGVGFGVYGYPDYYPYYSGYYDPYYYNYDYAPYCSDYDYSYGYCSY